MLSDESRLAVKLQSMLANDWDMKRKRMHLKPLELLALMDHVRKTQHSKISYDDMLHMIEDIGKIDKELRDTGRYFVKQLSKQKKANKYQGNYIE